jgi:predicted membrane chloride channel (bestrophin family)
MEDSLIQYREEEKFFSLKSYYTFKYKIEQVWKIISHPAKLIFVLGEWVDKIEYIEDNLKKIHFSNIQ